MGAVWLYVNRNTAQFGVPSDEIITNIGVLPCRVRVSSMPLGLPNLDLQAGCLMLVSG